MDFQISNRSLTTAAERENCGSDQSKHGRGRFGNAFGIPTDRIQTCSVSAALEGDEKRLGGEKILLHDKVFSGRDADEIEIDIQRLQAVEGDFDRFILIETQ